LALNDRSNELKPPLEVEDNVVGIMKSLVDLRDDEDMGRVNVKIWVHTSKKYIFLRSSNCDAILHIFRARHPQKLRKKLSKSWRIRPKKSLNQTMTVLKYKGRHLSSLT